MIKNALISKSNIFSPFKTHAYNKEFAKLNPTYFYPSGFICFVGNQGSGKTLTAVGYVYNLLELYPNCILVSNIDLTDYPIDNTRVFRFESANDLLKYKNGINGVIFLIDEVHLYLGSQIGANNINPEVLQAICQQRKQRIHIVSTSQYFAQLNINLRRHFDSIIICESKLFGLRQKIMVVNKDSLKSKESSNQVLEGVVSFQASFWREPYMFARYDTYAVINNNLKVGVESLESVGVVYDNSDSKLSDSIRVLGSNIKSISAHSSNILNR